MGDPLFVEAPKGEIFRFIIIPLEKEKHKALAPWGCASCFWKKEKAVEKNFFFVTNEQRVILENNRGKFSEIHVLTLDFQGPEEGKLPLICMKNRAEGKRSKTKRHKMCVFFEKQPQNLGVFPKTRFRKPEKQQNKLILR